MPETFPSLFDDLTSTIRSEDGKAFQQCGGEIWERAQGVGPDELTAGIERIAPVLLGCGGLFAKTAVLAGALVERGGSPLPLRETQPKRAAMALRMRARFPAAWAAATDGRPLPDPRGGPAAMVEAQRQLMGNAERTGLPQDACFVISVSWFDADDWLNAMITVLARREFRAAMAHRASVRDAAAAIADDVPSAHWVHGLTLVLDDEPLIALDPHSGRAFRLTMSGVGDNYQLHTLLADRLIGPGRLDGERPDDAWVAAATDSPPALADGGPIYRRFRLFDGHGSYVFPEGRPADIAPLGGMRVVVLHPPRGDFGWLNGRTYEHMEPHLALEQELAPTEAAHWLARIAPARETDLMGMNA